MKKKRCAKCVKLRRALEVLMTDIYNFKHKASTLDFYLGETLAAIEVILRKTEVKP